MTVDLEAQAIRLGAQNEPIAFDVNPHRKRSPVIGKTTTFTRALLLSGMTSPLVLDGPMTRAWFLAYVEQVLRPTLRPGDVVTLDNLPARKGLAIRNPSRSPGQRSASCRPTVPTNPIENGLRQAQGAASQGGGPHTRNLWRVIGESLDTITPKECATYF